VPGCGAWPRAQAQPWLPQGRPQLAPTRPPLQGPVRLLQMLSLVHALQVLGPVRQRQVLD